MNEWKCDDLKCVRKPTKSRLSLTHRANKPSRWAEWTLNGPWVRGISPVGKEKVYGGNDLVKSQVLRSEWKTERVREDASGDREDGKEDDDDMPCVIGESEGDCVWRGSRRSVGSSFHRRGAAYWKERLEILRVERVGGRVRVKLFLRRTFCMEQSPTTHSRNNGHNVIYKTS